MKIKKQSGMWIGRKGRPERRALCSQLFISEVELIRRKTCNCTCMAAIVCRRPCNGSRRGWRSPTRTTDRIERYVLQIDRQFGENGGNLVETATHINGNTLGGEESTRMIQLMNNKDTTLYTWVKGCEHRSADTLRRMRQRQTFKRKLKV